MPRKPKPSGRKQYSRRINTREELPRILIVCEGEETEPKYFKSFRVSSLAVAVRGLGRDPNGVVRYAISKKGEYEHVWCVFDKDEIPDQSFNAAIREAEENGIKVAYSNQAFELWYLLHFDYVDVACPRQDYISRLKGKLHGGYRKNDAGLYDLLLPRQEAAIGRAARLLDEYPHDTHPSQKDPSTTVHRLVAFLNQYMPNKRFD